MSEAAALGRSPDYTSVVAGERYKVNVPIRVIVCRAMRASIFDGRGTSLSEGGMALFAGAELRPGDQVAVEFTPPFHRHLYGWTPELQSGRLSLWGGVSGASTTPRGKASAPHALGICILAELCSRQSSVFSRQQIQGRRLPTAALQLPGQNGLQVSAEATERLQPLWRGVHNLLLGLEDLPAFLFGQHSDGFSHPPARCAQHLQPIRPRAPAVRCSYPAPRLCTWENDQMSGVRIRQDKYAEVVRRDQA